MFTGRDYLVEAERRKSEVVQAEQHRLRKQVSKSNKPALEGNRHLLAHLGRLLVTWRLNCSLIMWLRAKFPAPARAGATSTGG